MTKGYTKEQLRNWKIEAFNQIHWHISHVDVILTEDMSQNEDLLMELERITENEK